MEAPLRKCADELGVADHDFASLRLSAQLAAFDPLLQRARIDSEHAGSFGCRLQPRRAEDVLRLRERDGELFEAFPCGHMGDSASVRCLAQSGERALLLIVESRYIDGGENRCEVFYACGALAALRGSR